VSPRISKSSKKFITVPTGADSRKDLPLPSGWTVKAVSIISKGGDEQAPTYVDVSIISTKGSEVIGTHLGRAWVSGGDSPRSFVWKGDITTDSDYPAHLRITFGNYTGADAHHTVDYTIEEIER